MFLLRAATTASCMCIWLAAARLGRLFLDGSGGLPDPASGDAFVETGMWCCTTRHSNAATFDVQDSLDESTSCHILKADCGRSLTAQTCLANVLLFLGYRNSHLSLQHRSCMFYMPLRGSLLTIHALTAALFRCASSSSVKLPMP